jgi:hypothetical protein
VTGPSLIVAIFATQTATQNPHIAYRAFTKLETMHIQLKESVNHAKDL